MSAGRIHRAAASGYEAAAEAYERGRPGYPAGAVAHLARRLGLGPGCRVADVGAGTGKMTSLLLATGAHVVAVEPVGAMRVALAQLVPGAHVVGATAEALPLAAASFDAAVVAQAFHWFDGPAAAAELRRVLVAGGGLGLVWNRRDHETPWMREVTAILDRYGSGVPRHRDEAWQAAFEASDAFEPLEIVMVPYHHAVDLDGALDRIASVSFVAALDPGLRAVLLAEVADVMRPHLDGGRLRMPYVTEVHTTRARRGPARGRGR